MGSAKEWMLDQERERMIQWMRDNYDIHADVDIDESYPGYNGMAAVYQDEQDHLEYEAHMQWFEAHPYDEIYNSFCGRMRQLKEMIEKDSNPFSDKMIHQMVYAHSVTLFEAMIGDVIKAIALKHPRMMEKLVKGIGEDTKDKFSLKEIFKFSSINGIIFSILNDTTFHNISKVELYVNMLTETKFTSTHAGRMVQITKIRHDFVHRNGKNKEGIYHSIDTKVVMESISVIEKFSEEVYQAIIGSLKTEEF